MNTIAIPNRVKHTITKKYSIVQPATHRQNTYRIHNRMPILSLCNVSNTEIHTEMNTIKACLTVEAFTEAQHQKVAQLINEITVCFTIQNSVNIRDWSAVCKRICRAYPYYIVVEALNRRNYAESKFLPSMIEIENTMRSIGYNLNQRLQTLDYELNRRHTESQKAQQREQRLKNRKNIHFSPQLTHV